MNEESYSDEVDDDFYIRNIIQVRYNGKFYTGIFLAKSARDAFEEFVEALLENGHIKTEQIYSILQLQFKNTLMSANDAIISFMWDRALEAEQKDFKIIYSIFDHGGWRFFGRI